jgi:GNAT superfamily N-acetyltransferase
MTPAALLRGSQPRNRRHKVTEGRARVWRGRDGDGTHVLRFGGSPYGAEVGEITVRRALDDDADRLALAGLRRRWEEEDAGAPIDDPGFEDRAVAWLAANWSHRIAWLAELDGVAVGLVTVVVLDRMPQPGRPDSGWGYVHHFFVVPEQRSSGIGAQLMAAVVAEAESRGWAQLLLNPRPRSRPFYARAGFVPADQLVVRRLG